jgi:hypothetical protein
MIFSDSRYASGYLYKAYDVTNNANLVTVQRVFPTETAGFYYYAWKEGDRIENVAYRLLGDASTWWKVMDYNPEIIDAINIPVGTLLRVPYDEQL